MFFHFSICAVLTLLVNGIVRPLDNEVGTDLRRVDTWVQVIDILAISSERSDLLKKKEFLHYMRTWTLHVVQDALLGGGGEVNDLPCLTEWKQRNASGHASSLELPVDEPNLGWDWLSDVGHVQPDIFPLDLINTGNSIDSWPANNGIPW